VQLFSVHILPDEYLFDKNVGICVGFLCFLIFTTKNTLFRIEIRQVFVFFLVQLNFVMSNWSGPRKILRHRNGST